MSSSSEKLPELISVHDQVIEQLHKLIHAIEDNRWDAGVVVMADNGRVDIRGLGVADTPVKATALLFMAITSLPKQLQSDMMTALGELMKRSQVIAEEAPLWRVKDHEQSPMPSHGSTC